MKKILLTTTLTFVILAISMFVFLNNNIKGKTITVFYKNQPLKDALVVVNEQNIILFGKNKKYILKTDNFGKVNLKISSLVNITAGKYGFYPANITLNLNRDSDSVEVFLTKNNNEQIVAIVDLVEVKTGKSVFEKNDSILWDEWKEYILDLENKGYFNEIKTKDWFIDELK